MFTAMAKSEIEHVTHYCLSSVIQHDVTKYQNTSPITQIFVPSLLQVYPDYTGINFNITSGFNRKFTCEFVKSTLPRRLEFRGDEFCSLERYHWENVSSLRSFMQSLLFINSVCELAEPQVLKSLLSFLHSGFLVPGKKYIKLLLYDIKNKNVLQFLVPVYIIQTPKNLYVQQLIWSFLSVQLPRSLYSSVFYNL